MTRSQSLVELVLLVESIAAFERLWGAAHSRPEGEFGILFGVGLDLELLRATVIAWYARFIRFGGRHILGACEDRFVLWERRH